MDDKIKKYLMNNSWYHGTTLLGWKQICELKVQAKHNVGHELDFEYGFYLSPSFDQAAYYITHLVKVIEGLKKSTRNKQISLHKQELCDRIKLAKVCLIETREELNVVDYYDS